VSNLTRQKIVLRIKLLSIDKSMATRFLGRAKQIISAFGLKPNQMPKNALNPWITFVWARSSIWGTYYTGIPGELFINLYAVLSEPYKESINFEKLQEWLLLKNGFLESVIFHEYVHLIQFEAGIVVTQLSFLEKLKHLVVGVQYHQQGIEQQAHMEQFRYMRDRLKMSNEEIKQRLLYKFLEASLSDVPTTTLKKASDLIIAHQFEEAANILYMWVYRYHIKPKTKQWYKWLIRAQMSRDVKITIARAIEELKATEKMIDEYISQMDEYLGKTPIIHLDKPIEYAASTKPLWLYTNEGCPYCQEAEVLLEEAGIPYQSVQVNSESDWMVLEAAAGEAAVPQVFLGDNYLGGLPELRKLILGETSPREAAEELANLWMGKHNIISVRGIDLDEENEIPASIQVLTDGNINNAMDVLPQNYHGYNIDVLTVTKDRAIDAFDED